MGGKVMFYTPSRRQGSKIQLCSKKFLFHKEIVIEIFYKTNTNDLAEIQDSDYGNIPEQATKYFALKMMWRILRG